MSSQNIEFRSGSSHPSRATACIPCRRRKIRCDRGRPVCQQCKHHDRSDDCQYEDSNERAETQILEDQISRLEARIRLLKKTPDAPASVTLSDPYPSQRLSVASQSPEHSELIVPTIDQLLDIFLPYSSEFGFFLNVPRFKSAMLLALPVGHASRPSPPLIYAVYLCGIHISRQSNSSLLEEKYLKLAVEATSTNLSESHPFSIMHGIQAEVLLAYYFIANSRNSEAKYSANAAVSLSVCAGLHKIGASQIGSRVMVLPPPRDSIEEGERILGIWSVLILDKSLAIVLGESLHMIFPFDDPTAKFETPWPLDMGGYMQARIRPNKGEGTIFKFLNGEPLSNGAGSPLAMHSKSVLLWEKVTEMVRSSNQGECAKAFASGQQFNHSSNNNLAMEPPHFSAFSMAFAVLDAQIDHLQACLPPFAIMPSIRNPELVRKLLLCHSILYGCLIHLHGIFAERSDYSKRKRLQASRGVFEGVLVLGRCNFWYIDPIIGVTSKFSQFSSCSPSFLPLLKYIWLEAARIITNEVKSLRSHAQAGDLSERSMSNLVERVLTTIQPFSDHGQMMRIAVKKIEDMYKAAERILT